MARPRTLPPLTLTEADRGVLEPWARSRTAKPSQVVRAQMLLADADGASLLAISQRLHVARNAVRRSVEKAVTDGLEPALRDLPRSGRPRPMTPEARAWILSLAGQQPTAVGWAPEFWSESLLARSGREHAVAAGHPRAPWGQQGTRSNMLAAQDRHPHRVPDSRQRPDPAFDQKMAQVLPVYEPVPCAFEETGRPTRPSGCRTTRNRAFRRWAPRRLTGRRARMPPATGPGSAITNPCGMAR